MDLFLETPTPNFMDTPVRNVSEKLTREEVYEIFDKTTKLLEVLSKDLEEQKYINRNNTDGLETMNMLFADYKDFKSFTLKSLQNNNEESLKRKIESLQKENEALKTIVAEKPNTIDIILEKSKIPHINPSEQWIEEKRRTRRSVKTTSRPIMTTNQFLPIQTIDDNCSETEEEVHTPQTTTNRIPTNRPNRRPSIVTNLHQENDKQTWKPLKKTVPGNSSYKDAVKYGRKTYIIGTSMVKGIRMKEFNQNLQNSFAKLRPFPGASTKQLQYYVMPTLTDDSPNRIVLHAGCNDVGDRNSTPEDIAKKIQELAMLCRSYGVNEVFISSIICRNNKALNEKVGRINFLLQLICQEHNFVYIDNSNITVDDLWKDGIHLVDSGKQKLSNNLLYFLNSYY